jgi:hypothetical protein
MLYFQVGNAHTGREPHAGKKLHGISIGCLQVAITVLLQSMLLFGRHRT